MTLEFNDILTELERWYARENGQYLLNSTRSVLQPILERAFGYHLVQVGLCGGETLHDNSAIRHVVRICERPGRGCTLQAHCEELPLESDSVDVLIAHHCLDYSRDPHQALREMQRVVAPQGHILIVGFNPYSALGLAGVVRAQGARSHWQNCQPVSRHRLTDWLRLLGCETQSYQHLYALPPLGRGRFRQAMVQADEWLGHYNLPVGGAYVLHALKQVSALNRPRRGLLSRRARLIDLGVPKPSASPTPAIPSSRQGDVAA